MMGRAKINLLLTGQIRQEETFRRLSAHIIAHREAFNQVAYSTWTTEILNNKSLINEVLPNVDLVDAGSIFPVQALLNRDVMSLIAQFQQLYRGLAHFQDGAAFMRVRADDASLADVDLTALVDSLSHHWHETKEQKTAVKCGSMDQLGFFDDRFYIAGSQHVHALRSLTFEHLLSIKDYALYPEFMFYSALLFGEGADLDRLLRADMRGIVRRTNHSISELPFGMSGQELDNAYGQFNTILQKKFCFLLDAESKYPVPGLRDYVSGSAFGAKTMTEALDRIATVRQHITTKLHSPFLPWQTQQNMNIIITLNRMFFAQQYADVNILAETQPKYLQDDTFVAEIVGISNWYLGNYKICQERLEHSFNLGNLSFNCIYYLCTVYIELSQKERLIAPLEWLVKLYAGHPHTQEHLRNATEKFGDEFSSQLNVNT